MCYDQKNKEYFDFSKSLLCISHAPNLEY